jgi:hypothetical protein
VTNAPSFTSLTPAGGVLLLSDSIVATTDVQVQAIQIIVDNNLYAAGNNTASFSTPAANLSVGNHTLVAKAWFNNGQSVMSSSYNITVQSQAVTPAFTSLTPSGGVLLQSGNIVATTNVQVQAIQIIVDNNLYAAGNNTSSFSTSAANLSVGNHSLVAKAWFNNGQSVMSNSYNITVQSQAATPTFTSLTPAGGNLLQSGNIVATTNVQVQTIQIIVDNNLFAAGDNTSSFSTSAANLSIGNHTLVAKAWFNNGQSVLSTSYNITVPVPSGFDGSANIPNPPASANNVDKIQELTGWLGQTGAVSQCPNGVASPNCNPVSANFNPTPVLSSDPIGFPGSDGISGEFQLYQSPAYATALWGHQVLTQAAARNFIWDFYIYVNSAAYGASELDLYTSLNNGQRFMMGSQCNRNNNTWDTWSESGQAWVHNASVPCNTVLAAGAWHHVTFYNTVNASNNTYTYQVLRIDGVDYVLNQTQSAQQVGWPDGLIGVQVQLDANYSGNGVNEYLENMQLYAW